MNSPFTGDYPDGAMVQCQRCAKNIRVKYYDSDTVVIVSTQEQQTLALRCQYCGYVMCDSCAHPAESLFPVCPSCHREWGPYYFTHDVVVPSLSTVNAAEVVPQAGKPTTPPPADAKDTPPVPVETLAAGEVDLFRDELERKRRNVLRRVLSIAILLVLVGFIIYAAFSRGGSWLRNGIGLLSSRPTRTPAALMAQNAILVNGTATQTTTPTATPARVASPTTLNPSSTVLVVATDVIPTSTQTPTRPTPTRPAPTSTPTQIPAATHTGTPSPTTTGSSQGDCIPALSVTINDLGKILCVFGIVDHTTLKGNSFSIYFSSDPGTFRIVVYDRVPNGIDPGVCVKVTGEIQELFNTPVIAPGYKDLIEICTP